MKEQMLRILKMVQEGRLTPDDAYDLIDAFVAFDSAEPSAAAEAQAPPPRQDKRSAGDPFRRFVDSIERMTKEGLESVDWTQIAGQVRAAAKRGVETLQQSVERISKGEFSVYWFGASEKRTVELPLTIQPGKTLKLERSNGDVQVTGGHDEGALIATATVRGKDRDDAKVRSDAWTPVIEEHDGGVTVRQAPDAFQEDLEIRIPAGVALDIRIQNGDVQVKHTNAGLRLEGKSGEVEAEGLRGAVEIVSYAGNVKVDRAEVAVLEIENKSGDVSLSRITGSISVRSSSGDVRCKEIGSNSISVETVSGDVDLDLSTPIDGALNLRTVSGDVLLDLAGGSSCRVSLSSLSGTVSSSIELADEKRSKERLTGTLGSGEGTLDVSAVSGDISLNLREHQ